MMNYTYDSATESEADRDQLKALHSALGTWDRALQRDDCNACVIVGKRGSIHTWGDGKTWVLYVSWTDGFAECEFAARGAARRGSFGCSGHGGPAAAQREYPMSALRQRMIEDMKLAGLSPTTHTTYIKAVRRLAAYYRRSPEHLSEEEVRTYLLGIRERGAARGTFKASHYGIQFLYRNTLNRDWALFSKKRSGSPSTSGSPIRSVMPKSGISCLA